jgi:hypothetical protein
LLLRATSRGFPEAFPGNSAVSGSALSECGSYSTYKGQVRCNAYLLELDGFLLQKKWKKLMERSRASGRGEEEWRGEEVVGEVR